MDEAAFFKCLGTIFIGNTCMLQPRTHNQTHGLNKTSFTKQYLPLHSETWSFIRLFCFLYLFTFEIFQTYRKKLKEWHENTPQREEVCHPQRYWHLGLGDSLLWVLSCASYDISQHPGLPGGISTPHIYRVMTTCGVSRHCPMSPDRQCHSHWGPLT